jgi:hypothetical protein
MPAKERLPKARHSELAFRELCGDTGGLDKERTMSDP